MLVGRGAGGPKHPWFTAFVGTSKSLTMGWGVWGISNNKRCFRGYSV